MTEPCRDRVLFVHPFGHPHQETVPYGAVGLMNAIPGPKLGLYAHELTEPLTRDARVVAMDLHWVHGLAPVQAVCRELRRVAPRATIVVGGYTATVLATELVARGVADVVVRGDAEHSFPRLVAALRADEDLTAIPNLVTRDGATPFTYSLDQGDFDAVDYLTIDWFPTLRRQVHLQHAGPKVSGDYPLVVTHKGCRSQRRSDPMCALCYGQPAAQQRLRAGGFVARSPARVRQDLERLSADPLIRRAMILYDVPGSGDELANKIFAQRYDLHLHFEPSQLCSVELLEQVAASFRSINLALYYADMAAQLTAGDRCAADLVAAAERLGCPVTLFTDQATAPALRELSAARDYQVFSVDDELIEAPDPATPPDQLPALYDEHHPLSARFVMLGLMGRVSPAFLDGVALDLGRLHDAQLRQDGWLTDNPIRRQLTTGDNPAELSLEIAPFRLPADEAMTDLMQVPKAWLLAAPSRLGGLRHNLGEPESVSLSAEWDIKRTGNPDGVAINVVSAQPERMVGLRYSRLWKLCLPLHRRAPLPVGRRRTVQLHFAAGLAHRSSVRAVLV
ncbi:MAG: cobalamin-dependent protein [Deltaproteobacteria bacterium]|nr:cobalamin-dependent protein [Deltaproteobacteria bacterium]